MKVFDFTDGKRGEQLAQVEIVSWTGGNLVKKGGHMYRVTLAGRHGGPGEKWAWCIDAGHGRKEWEITIRPEHFGVEAICFCLGEWFDPESERQKEWRVLGSKGWNRRACESGVLKAELEGDKV